LQQDKCLLPDGLPARQQGSRHRITLEMTAMLTLKNHLRFLNLSSTLSLLIAGLAMTNLSLAQFANRNSAGTGRAHTLWLAIVSGLQTDAQKDQIEAMAEYQKMLQANPRSSLANYRIGDLLFNQTNYQASANRYRDALKGDGDPSWTRVWSHLQLGKIFDITNQRDRAVKEYRLAMYTNDNTRGALTEAEQLLQEPYKRPDAP
jgi:tetratricopeptide (TPR) repeat protein